MELIIETIKGIAVGDKVRTGFRGLLPVFSVSDVINVVCGKDQSSAYGNNFVNTVLKQRYPHLASVITPFRLDGSVRESPCADMFGMLKIMGVLNCEFTTKLNELAAAGILQAEAGDQGLIEYVLRNAAANSKYHTLMRQILWAERNPESALSNVDPVDDSVGGAQTSSGSLLQQQPHAPNPEVHTTPIIFLLSAHFIDAQYFADFHRPSPCGWRHAPNGPVQRSRPGPLRERTCSAAKGGKS